MINLKIAFWGGILLGFGIVLKIDSRLISIVKLHLLSNQMYFDLNSNNKNYSEQCSSWKKVSTNAFGLPSEFNSFGKPIKPITSLPYQGEEGYEVLVFKNQLYLGMEADNVAAGLLQEVVEDTEIEMKGLEEELGSGVDRMVDGVNKLEQIEKEQIDWLRKKLKY